MTSSRIVSELAAASLLCLATGTAFGQATGDREARIVFGGGNDAAGASIPPTRVPFFLVFSTVDGRWGVAVEQSGVRLK